MAGYFLDSSALAKFYHAEAGSAVVEELVLSSTATLLISRLSVVEVQSAFAGNVRAGVISVRHGATHGLRSLDSLQLAVALSLHRASAVESLVAADKVLCRVAVIEGMPVTDPEPAAP